MADSNPTTPEHIELNHLYFAELIKVTGAQRVPEERLEKFNAAAAQLTAVMKANCAKCALSRTAHGDVLISDSDKRTRFLLRFIGSKISRFRRDPGMFPPSIFEAIDTYLLKVCGPVVYHDLNSEAEHVVARFAGETDEFIWKAIEQNPSWKRLAENILIKMLLRFEHFQAGKLAFLTIINEELMAKSNMILTNRHFDILLTELFSDLRASLKDKDKRMLWDFNFGNGISKRIEATLAQVLGDDD